MTYKISKELFEAVMSVKVTTELSISHYYNEINGCEEDDLILINYNFIWVPLDTFFFKCKEWAWSKAVHVNIVRNESGFKAVLEHRFGMDFDGLLESYAEEVVQCMNPSEQQAVFNACQWILENKDKR